MESMRSEIKQLRESMIKYLNIRDAIIEAYQCGLNDGYNEMYNSDYAGTRDTEKPIEGEEAVVARIIKKFS